MSYICWFHIWLKCLSDIPFVYTNLIYLSLIHLSYVVVSPSYVMPILYNFLIYFSIPGLACPWCFWHRSLHTLHIHGVGYHLCWPQVLHKYHSPDYPAKVPWVLPHQPGPPGEAVWRVSAEADAGHGLDAQECSPTLGGGLCLLWVWALFINFIHL